MPDFLLYGATGYTGELIAREAVRRGMRPLLAGRNEATIAKLAAELDCPHIAFSLDDSANIAHHLRHVRAVLHCAGPFVHTAPPMMDACIQAGVHYLDITGEIPGIEAAATRDPAAKSANVALIPAVGFDVVPTDCLAARLARELPTATHLQLAIAGLGGGLSRGTLKTIVESIPEGGRARIDGRIVRVPTAWKTMQVPFRERKLWAMTIPWGDVASAFYSTGIPNIEVYMAMPRRRIKMARWSRPLLSLLKLRTLRKLAQRWIDRTVTGPSTEERTAGRTSIWGRVSDPGGRSIEGTLTGPDGYTMTVLTAVAAMQRVLAGGVRPGFSTPSQAFGAELITSVPGMAMEVSNKPSAIES